ncbi:unnamed protein product [Rotaria socialis]
MYKLVVAALCQWLTNIEWIENKYNQYSKYVTAEISQNNVTLMANDKVPHRNRKHRSYRFRSPAISDIRFCRDLS